MPVIKFPHYRLLEPAKKSKQQLKKEAKEKKSKERREWEKRTNKVDYQ